jgi:prevent-host-death family protein
MTTLTVSKARQELAEIVNKVHYGGERIIISRRGKIKVAVVSMRDVELLQRLEDEIDLKAAASRKREPSTRWKKVKKDLGL